MTEKSRLLKKKNIIQKPKAKPQSPILFIIIALNADLLAAIL